MTFTRPQTLSRHRHQQHGVAPKRDVKNGLSSTERVRKMRAEKTAEVEAEEATPPLEEAAKPLGPHAGNQIRQFIVAKGEPYRHSVTEVGKAFPAVETKALVMIVDDARKAILSASSGKKWGRQSMSMGRTDWFLVNE